MINFNMTLNMSGGGSLFGAGNLTGAGLASGGFGLPFGGGGAQGILPAAFTTGGPSNLEMQLLRLMLARAANGADSSTSPPAARDSDLEARVRAAQDRIDRLRAEMEDNTLSGINQMKQLTKRVLDLEARLAKEKPADTK
jgi:hypothetical protein